MKKSANLVTGFTVPETPKPFEKQFFKLSVTSFLKWVSGLTCLILVFLPFPKWVRQIGLIFGE